METAYPHPTNAMDEMTAVIIPMNILTAVQFAAVGASFPAQMESAFTPQMNAMEEMTAAMAQMKAQTTAGLFASIKKSSFAPMGSALPKMWNSTVNTNVWTTRMNMSTVPLEIALETSSVVMESA